jgi:pimeloyl-ACP methyl ester carboxylesterase
LRLWSQTAVADWAMLTFVALRRPLSLSEIHMTIQDPPVPLSSIVLVHGAWTDGSCWREVILRLQARGEDVIAVQSPLTSLADDVAAVGRALATMTRPVVLVGHSWGGAVITQAGETPKVKALVYVAAFGPDTGESVNDLGREKPPPPAFRDAAVSPEGLIRLSARGMAEDFAQDLSPADAKYMFAAQGPTSERCFDEALAAAAWRTRPTWYVLAEHDRMIAPQGQALMAARMGATTVRASSSHVVMISHPDVVTEVILEASRAVRGSLTDAP